MDTVPDGKIYNYKNTPVLFRENDDLKSPFAPE